MRNSAVLKLTMGSENTANATAKKYMVTRMFVTIISAKPRLKAILFFLIQIQRLRRKSFLEENRKIIIEQN